MPTMPPPEVVRLAEDRAEARAAKDFTTSDALREAIAEAGWVVTDQPDGWRLSPKPPYEVLRSVADLPDRGSPPGWRVTVALLVERGPQDLRTCVEALLAHAPADVGILGLDLANRDGSGDVLHELAVAHPDRIAEWHVASPAGWAPARSALLRLDQAEIHIWMETSTILDGDALTPVLEAFRDPDVVAAGWQGANVDLTDDWRSFSSAGPGDVDALLGYLFAMRRTAALDAGGPHPKARFYRNADLEFSFALREATGGRLVVPQGDLPLRQTWHRGYHDTDPTFRDRESKRTFDRFLQRFRGRVDLLAPRPPAQSPGTTGS